MKSSKDGYGYNERLFSGVGLRSKLHFSRFKWFLAAVTKLNCPTDTVLELGCFDGKLIDFLPSKPSRYIGFDANWEGGLDIAKTKWADSPNFSFLPANSSEDMHLNNKDIFNIAVAMETLEHVPPQLVDGYLRKIAQHLNGYFFVTVPNEKGFLFLIKWLIKKIFSDDTTHYSLSELANATLGRMNLVDREEHKGFDYDSLIKDIEKYFDVVEVSGFPFGFCPIHSALVLELLLNPRRPYHSRVDFLMSVNRFYIQTLVKFLCLLRLGCTKQAIARVSNRTFLKKCFKGVY